MVDGNFPATWTASRTDARSRRQPYLVLQSGLDFHHVATRTMISTPMPLRNSAWIVEGHVNTSTNRAVRVIGTRRDGTTPSSAPRGLPPERSWDPGLIERWHEHCQCLATAVKMDAFSRAGGSRPGEHRAGEVLNMVRLVRTTTSTPWCASNDNPSPTDEPQRRGKRCRTTRLGTRGNGGRLATELANARGRRQLESAEGDRGQRRQLPLGPREMETGVRVRETPRTGRDRTSL